MGRKVKDRKCRGEEIRGGGNTKRQEERGRAGWKQKGGGWIWINVEKRIKKEGGLRKAKAAVEKRMGVVRCGITTRNPLGGGRGEPEKGGG